MDNSRARRDRYNLFVEKQGLPLFYQSWFLDEVSDSGTWDVSLVERDGEVVAVWPYFQKKKYGISYLTTPPLTAYLGPWYSLPSNIKKETSIQSYHQRIITELAQGLPKSHLIDTRWHPEVPDWMALSWSGYQQSTRYTYHLDLDKQEDELFMAMKDSQRNTIRKSLVKYDVVLDSDVAAFWKLNKAAYDRQSMKVPYGETFFKSLHKKLMQHDAVEIWLSKDDHGIQGGAFVAFDTSNAYLIATGRSGQDNGAVSVAIWRAVLSAQRRGCKTFDFEGSMIEGISSYFKSFGGRLTPYNRIIKNRNKFWEILFRVLNRF